MGADFCYATIAVCELTEERQRHLLSLSSDEKVQTDIKEAILDDSMESIDEYQECIRNMVSEYLEFDGRRDTGIVSIPVMSWPLGHYIPIEHYITGGMSFGDDPTDSFGSMAAMDFVFGKTLTYWAIVDVKGGKT